MSDLQKHNKSKIHKLPLIIKKNSIKACSDYGMFFRRQTNSENVIKEDIIYKATEGDFLHGKYPALCIINRLDVAKNSSRTVATYDSPNGAVIELSSDAVVKLIGQANYDQLFASLCCVINQELKIKGILSLLCPRVPEDTVFSTVESQTIESSFKHLIREKLRRTRQSKRSKLRTYIVEEPVVAKKVVPGKLETELKRVVINPADFTEFRDIKVEVDAHNINDSLHNDKSSIDIKVEPNIQEDGNINSDDNQSISDVKESNAGVTDPFPDLKLIVDEDSNISEVGSIGNLSIGSITSLPNIDVSNAKSILNYIDDHIQFDKQYDNKCKMQTENSTITMIDGSTVTIRGNPDIFHIAEPEILKDLSPTNQKKLMLHQAYLDWKFCLQRDEDDNLPIHLAVLNNDVSLLKRHCLMLKSRHQSTDIVAAGNLTALQMSILRDCPGCTVALLAHGADVMVRDGEARTTLHLAVEIGAEHVKAILDHCMNNAREIVKEHDEFWKPELENEPNDKITKYLLTQINAVCDNQGYTPLMLASKIGNAAAVVLLVAAAPSIVNMPMPTSGNTALYLAVGAACMEAANCGDKTKIPENFKKTVEILVENKADPSIDNHSGNNVNALLAEFHDIALSFVIASKLASINGFGIQKYDDVMLLRDANGVISVADLNKFSINKVKNNPKVYSNSKTIKHSCDADANNSNDNGKNDTIVSGKNCNNDNSITKMAVVEPDKNVKSTAKNYTKSGETVKRPVIIKNLPVVTKIVSLGSNKPVLVKGISPKVAGNGKNLLTKIVAKPNTVKRTITCSMPVTDNISSAPKNILKIFPKPQSETSDTVKKKIPIILKNTAVKRTKCGNGLDHAPSTSKKPRA